MSTPNPFGQIASGIYSMTEGNPANAANPYYNQVNQQLPGYYQPYTQGGSWAGNKLQDQFGTLLKNPGQFVNSVGSNYQQSPGLQFQEQQATNAANNASAAGGMAGSPQEQQQLATTVNGLANQDYYQYLNSALGEYNQGLSGTENMYDTGANSANNLATNIGQNLSNQGNLAYAGQINQNQAVGGGIGSLIGGIGGLFGGGSSGSSGANHPSSGYSIGNLLSYL